METWVEILTGPRFAKLPSFVRDQCWALGLKPDLEVDKGWIRETVRVRVTGEADKISRLKSVIYDSLDAYNKKSA